MRAQSAKQSKIKTLILILGIASLTLMAFYFGFSLTPAGQAFVHSSGRLYYFLSSGILDVIRTGLSASITPFWDVIVPVFNAVAGITANIFSFIPTLSVFVPAIFTVICFIHLGTSMHSFYAALQNEKSQPEKATYWHAKRNDALIGIGFNGLICAGIIGLFLLGLSGPVFPIMLTVGFSGLLAFNLYRSLIHPLTPPEENQIHASETTGVLESARSQSSTVAMRRSLSIGSVRYEDEGNEAGHRQAAENAVKQHEYRVVLSGNIPSPPLRRVLSYSSVSND